MLFAVKARRYDRKTMQHADINCARRNFLVVLQVSVPLDKDGPRIPSQELPCTKLHVLRAFPVLILSASDLRAEDSGANSCSLTQVQTMIDKPPGSVNNLCASLPSNCLPVWKLMGGELNKGGAFHTNLPPIFTLFWRAIYSASDLSESLHADMTSRLGAEHLPMMKKFADLCVPAHVLGHAKVSAVSFVMFCVHSHLS